MSLISSWTTSIIGSAVVTKVLICRTKPTAANNLECRADFLLPGFEVLLEGRSGLITATDQIKRFHQDNPALESRATGAVLRVSGETLESPRFTEPADLLRQLMNK